MKKLTPLCQGGQRNRKADTTLGHAFPRENRRLMAKTAIDARAAGRYRITVPSVADGTVILRVYGFPLSYRQKGVHA